MTETRVTVCGGKYTVVHDCGRGLHALRHGEPWRDLTGDGLVLALVQALEELRDALVPVVDFLGKNDTGHLLDEERVTATWGKPRAAITVGDLRRLREAVRGV